MWSSREDDHRFLPTFAISPTASSACSYKGLLVHHLGGSWRRGKPCSTHGQNLSTSSLLRGEPRLIGSDHASNTVSRVATHRSWLLAIEPGRLELKKISRPS